MTPEQAFVAAIQRWEGLYSDDPRDPGNWVGSTMIGTMRGVTAAAYAAFLGIDPSTLTPDRMKTEVTLDVAGQIGVKDYYVGTGLDLLPWGRFAAIAVDIGWGSGPKRAVKMVQQLVGTMADGDIGPETIATTGSYLALRSEAEACDALSAARRDFYEQIGAPGSRLHAFLKGWLNRADWFLSAAPADSASWNKSWWSLW